MSLLLDHGVKVVLLASLDDQMVPIYSAAFSSATHPLLLRALYIDARTYAAEDWMTSMLVFCMMLRNAGLDDQGLMTHLSEVTAGGLTGESRWTMQVIRGSDTLVWLRCWTFRSIRGLGWL